MNRTKVHLKDLVARHDASGAEWHYIENTDHVTPGVMCWLVILFHALIPVGPRGQLRVTAHTIKLANCADLIVDEYVADLVTARMNRETT